MNATLTNTQLDLSAWFDDFVAQIRADQLELESGIASKEKKDLYYPILKGNLSGMMENVRQESTKFFISQIVKDYFSELIERKTKPVSLALQLSESKILVWAVIKDDDEKCEDQLFLSEAATNSRFYDRGFHISSTIVEESDSCNVPNHFIEVLNG